MLRLLLILLPFFVQSDTQVEIETYKSYARQIFSLENVSMKDETGKEYIFVVTLKNGEWAIYEWRENIPLSEDNPRKFKVVHEPGTTATFYSSKDSHSVTEYPKDAILEISEYIEIPEENRIRGKVKGEDQWVSIKNTATNYMWIKPVTPAPLIKFSVEIANSKNKKMHIEFRKLEIINKNSKNEDNKIFFKMFEKVYEYSPYPDTQLKLIDFHSPFKVDRNIVPDDLKFTHLFKNGKTFFEEYNFEYLSIDTVPLSYRHIKDENLSSEELKNIHEKFPKLSHLFEPTTISKLVSHIELFYPEQNFDEIFLQCFEDSRPEIELIMKVCPVNMIYKSPRKRFEIDNKDSKRNTFTKIFNFSKTSDKDDIRFKDDNRF